MEILEKNKNSFNSVDFNKKIESIAKKRILSDS